MTRQRGPPDFAASQPAVVTPKQDKDKARREGPIRRVAPLASSKQKPGFQ